MAARNRILKLTNRGQLNFYEDAANGSNKLVLRAGAALAGDLTLNLPTAAGSTGQILQNDGSSGMEWSDALGAKTFTSLTLLDQGKLYFREGTAGGTDTVVLKAPATVAAPIEFTLPGTIVDGGILTTNASGVLSWTTSSATLQQAYTAGEDITMAAGKVMDWGQANDEGMLALTKTGTGVGTVLSLHNDGTGTALDINQDGDGKCLNVDAAAASTSDVIAVLNAGTGRGLFLNQDGNAAALEIDHDGTGKSLVINNAAGVAAVDITQAGDAPVIAPTKTGTGAGAVIDISNGGTGVDIDGAGSTWSVRKGGGIKCTGLVGTWEVYTIASDKITVDADTFLIKLRGEGDANDALYEIDGGTDGQVIVLMPDDTATYGTITVTQHATLSNIRLTSGSGVLNNNTDTHTLVFRADLESDPAFSGTWCELGRGANGAL